MNKSYSKNIVFLLITLLTFVLSEVQAQTYRILPLGNSITVGQNGTSPPLDEAVAYRDTLFDQLNTEGYLFDFVGHASAGSDFMSDPEHGGISGTRGQYVVRLLQDGYDSVSFTPVYLGGLPYLDKFPADIILLHIGTNDISSGEGTEADDVEDILDEIDAWELTSGNHVAVFVARIIDRTDNVSLSTNTHIYNDNVAAMISLRGDPSIIMVDIEGGADINYGTEMDPDGIHPLQIAYNKMGVSWYTALDDYMSVLPAIPGSFSLGGETSASITLSWSDLSANETGFEIERSLTGLDGDFAWVHKADAESTSYTDLGLEDVTQYYYRIRAVNATGPSFYTSIETATTLLSAPSAPGTLAVEGFTASNIELSWSDNSDNESGFEIQRSSPSFTSFGPIHTTGAEVTGYTDPLVNELTRYYYRVRAINAAGESGWSNMVSATTSQDAPTAPTGLSAGTINVSSIQMTWNDLADNETAYVVQRSLDGSNYTNLPALPADRTYFTNTGLDDNTSYFYRVYARNAAGDSDFSNVINVTTPLAVPDDPTTLTITDVGTNSITLTWNDQSDNEEGFLIESYSESETEFSVIHTTAPDVQTYTNTGLSDNTLFYYRIRAYNGAGFSGYTSEVSATTQLSAPLAPGDLLLDNFTENSIRLNWTDNSDNESEFEIERSERAGRDYDYFSTAPENATSFTNSSLNENTTYYYRVRAVNTAGPSPYSNEEEGTTLLLAPDAPSDMTFTLVTENSMRISWQDNSGNEENFEIQRSTEAGDGFQDVGAPTDSYFDDSGLAENVEYFYRVRAINTTAFSAWITGSDTTLLLAPIKPDRLQGTATDICSVDLSWRDRSSNEEGFIVQRSLLLTSGFEDVKTLAPDVEAYTDTDTENNTSYFYRIAAFNGTGTVYSDIAVVSVSITLDGGVIRDDQIVCPEGDPERILNSVSPSGGSNIWTYQWQSRTDPDPFADIPSATGITYNPPAGALLTTEYQRVSTVECGSAISNIVIISVEDIEDPQFTTCPADELIEIERNELMATVATVDPEYTDNCVVSVLSWTMTGATEALSPPTGINLVGTADFNLGITTVTYVAEDLLGNKGTCEYDIEVKIKDPEVLNVSIPNATMKIGDVITATIEVGDDGSSVYTLLSGDIGAYPLVDFVRINSTTYLANFLIVEGGNSYEALENIPVGNLIVSDGTTPSLPYNTPIVQNNDLLDAELPVVISADLVEGLYKIGDRVVINILADGPSYTLNEASTVNGINVTEPNFRFNEIGDGSYELVYTVVEGDADIAPGDFEASLILDKPSGNPGDPFTDIGNVDVVEIDANAPVLARIEVPEEEVGVGGVVVATLTADGTGYTVSPGTLINGVPISSDMVEFEEVSDGLYTIIYEVSSTDNVVAPGELEMSVILRDSAGNLGDPYDLIEENELEIYTQLPLTHMVTLPEICEGEVAELIIYLIGRQPFSIELFDGDTTVLIEDIDTSTYTVLVTPLETTWYSVPVVKDRNGVENSGSGSVKISVNPSDTVRIVNLQSGYSVETPPFKLEADTPGGIFTGPGVNSATSYFSPALADTINSPHTIYYTFTNPNGCNSVDSALVFVLGANGDIHIPNSKVCDNSDPFLTIASNIAGVIGTFTLFNSQDNEVAGLEDHGDNTATIDPAILAAGNYTIEYAYFDEVMLYIREKFELIYLADPEIISPSGTTSFCQNEDVIQLIANDPGAIFFGEGITGSIEEGYIFDPAAAPVGESSINCLVHAEYGCEKSTSLDIMVHSASEARFTVNSTCLPDGGGMISFNNQSTSKLEVESWAWDFGDPLSGADNYSGEIDPEHFYPNPGEWSISLSATTFHGCVSSFSLDTIFSSTPNSDFTWISDCFIDNQGMLFVNQSADGDAEVESMKWIFMTESEYVLDEIISESDTIEYQFPLASVYKVGLLPMDQGSCGDTVTKTVKLRPTYKLDADGYSEAFDFDTGGWTIESEDENSSWVWGAPDFEDYIPEGEGKSWYTDLESYSPGYVEHSWIQSPCLDFSGMDRPMISMDVLRSFVPNVNGAVLQYMENREDGWITIGAESNGINWYNSFNIYNKPGGSPTGWGLDVFYPDTDWMEATHDLSSLRDKHFASLRVAIASNGAQGIGNQGFAFDNLIISEKTKLAVLEHFTNSSDDNSFYADILVDGYASKNRSEVVDLQYHTAYPGEDPMNQNNPGMVTTRAGNLSVGLVPYAVLDGGTSSQYRYDFSTIENSPGSEELDLLSLAVPSFEIDLEVDWTQSDLTAYTTVTCSADSYSEYIQLYVVVFETLVTSYQGANGDTEFRNVVLDMLPSPAGKLLGENWYQGVSMSLTNQWTFEPYVEDVADLVVVAFVQDRNTKEILQAAVNHKTPLTGILDRFANVRELQVYPNPAKDFLYVNLGSRSDKEGILEIYDLSGRMVLNLETQPGYQIFNVDVQDLNRGMYIIRRFESGQMVGWNKFIKTE